MWLYSKAQDFQGEEFSQFSSLRQIHRNFTGEFFITTPKEDVFWEKHENFIKKCYKSTNPQ